MALHEKLVVRGHVFREPKKQSECIHGFILFRAGALINPDG